MLRPERRVSGDNFCYFPFYRPFASDPSLGRCGGRRFSAKRRARYVRRWIFGSADGIRGAAAGRCSKAAAAEPDVPAERRGAKFVAAVCFILPTGRHLTCRGECPGKVAFARLAGDYGFGYDPLFIPDECGVGKAEKRPNTEGRSYAQLTPDEKDAISHRGVALAKLEKELPEFLK